MRTRDEIIDLTADPLAEQADRRRQWLRIGMPVLGVALTIAMILGIAVYANRANTAGALVLSDQIMTALDARIGAELADYFAPAKRSLRTQGAYSFAFAMRRSGVRTPSAPPNLW